MRRVAGGVLVALAAFGLGWWAGTCSSSPRAQEGGTDEAAGGERLASLLAAVHRMEARFTSSPTLSPAPVEARPDAEARRVAELLAGLTERLERLERAGGPPVERERTATQEERLQALAEGGGEAEPLRRQHFLWTARDLLERYGIPDDASYWSGLTVRWVCLMPRLGPGARAVFELTGGHVTAAFVERGR